MNTLEFVLYRNMEHQELFDSMAKLLDQEEGAELDVYACANQLLELAAAYGFEGNLWHCFLAYCLATHENAYSTACEIVGPVHGTINQLAAHDFSLMKELFEKDITSLSGGIWQYLSEFHGAERTGKVFNRRIRDRIITLARDLEAAGTTEKFQALATGFYKEFGVGRFGLHKAFRIEERKEKSGRERTWIEPITSIDHVYLDDLVGYEIQKKKLIENT